MTGRYNENMSLEKPSRRDVLKGIAATGAAPSLGSDAKRADQKMERKSHVYSKDMREAGLEKTQKNSFERQFAKRETIETADGPAEVVDIMPEHSKDDIPVLFAPAWACTLPIYKPLLKTLVGEGRRTISINQPRAGGSINLSEQEKELIKEYPTNEVLKALVWRDVVKQKQLQKAEAIGHSEGAANVAIAALLLAEEAERENKEPPIQRMVLFGPVGLIGGDTPKRLLAGFGAQGNPKPSLNAMTQSAEVDEGERRRTGTEGAVPIQYPEIAPNPEAVEAIVGKGTIPVMIKETLKFAGEHPVKTMEEWWGMSQIQIGGLIKKLREHNIGIVVMSGADDPVFPIGRMAGTIDEKTGEVTLGTLRAGDVDGFLAVRGGHGQIGDNPERYAVAANQMLVNLRNRKRRAATADTSA